MKHNLTMSYQYVNMDCWGFQGRCSCGYECFVWLEDECGKKLQEHKLEKEFNLSDEDIKKFRIELIEQVEAKIKGYA